MVAATASDVMFVDTMIRSGRGVGFFPIRPPYVPGSGVGGEVISVGDGVDEGWLGRRVIAHTGSAGGGYAERAAVSLEDTVAVPDGLDPLLAVAIIHDGPTALRVAPAGRRPARGAGPGPRRGRGHGHPPRPAPAGARGAGHRRRPGLGQGERRGRGRGRRGDRLRPAGLDVLGARRHRRVRPGRGARRRRRPARTRRLRDHRRRRPLLRPRGARRRLRRDRPGRRRPAEGHGHRPRRPSGPAGRTGRPRPAAPARGRLGADPAARRPDLPAGRGRPCARAHGGQAGRRQDPADVRIIRPCLRPGPGSWSRYRQNGWPAGS